MYSRAVILCAAAALLAVSAAPADDKPAADKPDKPKAALKKGADLPGPFHPYNVANGKYENKFHSLTNEHGLNPGVLVFVQNVPTTEEKSPLVTLLHELDKYITERPETRLKAFAVFLFPDMPDVVKDDDIREAHVQELQKLKSATPPLQQVVLALDSPDSLQKAGYEMPTTEQVRVVLYNELKVNEVYHFGKGENQKELTDADVKKIVDDVKTKLAPYKQR
jgi:hypothetical protein